MDWPRPEITPTHIHSMTRYSEINSIRNLISSSHAAYNWPAQNQAVYIPFAIPFHYPVKRIFWASGTTITTSNMDFGIYSDGGTRIFSTGTTAMANAGSLQYVTPTAFLLTPGRYFFALACDSATTTARGWGLSTVSTLHGRFAGCLQQATAFVLPATATFAAWNSTGVPLCGITKT